MSELAFTDYAVRVWCDGDVNISSWSRLSYAQLNGMSSLQCNAKEGTDGCNAVKSACMDVANAMRALNDVLMALEDER
ncbi:MAG: hypothetical protein IKG21_13000 [Atopobiaceae bacterium]|nr:hypothetical protein [Atopobiaceae bacterium]